LNDRLPTPKFSNVTWLVQKLITDTMHMHTHTHTHTHTCYVQTWLYIKLERKKFNKIKK
jgi:hypothetical protein